MSLAVVTGVSSGIGEATARALLADGWEVRGWDLGQPRVDGVVWTRVDVSDPGSVAAAAAEVPEIDLLVNSAGIADRAPASEMRIDQWRRVIDVDLSGTFYCAQALYPALKVHGGVVINVASIAGHRAFAGRANYCAAKAGVVMLTQVLAQEWASDGIRVLAVSPGFVATEMVVAGIDGGWVSEEAIRGRTPMDRLADPDEIARSIIALAGGAFSYATGAAVLVDGGWSANGGF
jgi:NAD(P)-dependent dehydrogenase (short-subunit alcohol dehydrogenase family)